MKVAERFATSARACEALGSPFAGRVLRTVPGPLDRSTPPGTSAAGASTFGPIDPIAAR